MVWLYAVALVVGFLLLLGWLIAVAAAAWVDGWESVDPEHRFGGRGRAIVAGSVGFGMGGMSATFAGLHPVVALGAALIGAAALVWVSRTFAPAQA